MEVKEVNSLKKLQLSGAIILAYDGGEGNWIISDCFCQRYGLDQVMSTQDINRLETIYKTKVVRVLASYEIDDRMAEAKRMAGYECN